MTMKDDDDGRRCDVVRDVLNAKTDVNVIVVCF